MLVVLKRIKVGQKFICTKGASSFNQTAWEVGQVYQFLGYSNSSKKNRLFTAHPDFKMGLKDPKGKAETSLTLSELSIYLQPYTEPVSIDQKKEIAKIWGKVFGIEIDSL